ncbi:MAG: EamA family transporter RarD [Candidatus Nanopelagicaceae bacterium]
MTNSAANQNYKLGLTFGFSAYILWGLFPLYWPLLKPATPAEIVSHRAVWTSIFCLLVLAFQKQLRQTFKLMFTKRVFFRLVAASALISINWLVYIWATNNGHVVEAALGYYINPLIIIAFGVILLGEKLRRTQWVAVALGALGVLVLTIDYGRLPWIALTLAISWGSYGLIKKQLNLGAVEGLTIETLISFIPYAGFILYLASTGEGQWGGSWKLTILLTAAGAITAIPLLLFNGSATRLPYSTIGLLQYITPTLQFSIGVWINHESMPAARWIGFVIIWGALIALATDLVRSTNSINNQIA